jgi:anaerobic selenocysteine-containing dehydrogenase
LPKTRAGYILRRRASIPVFCGKDCGGNACPLLATLEDGRVTAVVNNPAGGNYLKGCPRGFNMPLKLDASDRLLKPLLRTGKRGSGRACSMHGMGVEVRRATAAAPDG